MWIFSPHDKLCNVGQCSPKAGPGGVTRALQPSSRRHFHGFALAGATTPERTTRVSRTGWAGEEQSVNTVMPRCCRVTTPPALKHESHQPLANAGQFGRTSAKRWPTSAKHHGPDGPSESGCAEIGPKRGSRSNFEQTLGNFRVRRDRQRVTFREQLVDEFRVTLFCLASSVSQTPPPSQRPILFSGVQAITKMPPMDQLLDICRASCRAAESPTPKCAPANFTESPGPEF